MMLILVEGCLFLLFCETFASVNNIVGREITIKTASSPERVILHSSHFDDFSRDLRRQAASSEAL